MSKIKDQLKDESQWTQGAFARNKEGKSVSIHDPTCTCLCLDGWIAKVYGDGPRTIWIFRRVIRQIGESLVFIWNDDPQRKFEEVKKLVNDMDI